VDASTYGVEVAPMSLNNL